MLFDNLFMTVKKEISGVFVDEENDTREEITVALDAVLTETTVYMSQTTKNPLESGVVITDHVIKQPKTYKMTAVFTDTPVGLSDTVDSLKRTIGSAVDDVSGIFGKQTDSGATRSKEQFDKLIKLLKSGRTVSVQSGLELHEDMILTRLEVTQDKDKSRSVHFTADFQEVFIVVGKKAPLDINKLKKDDPLSDEEIAEKQKELGGTAEQVNTDVNKTSKSIAKELNNGEKGSQQLTTNEIIMLTDL